MTIDLAARRGRLAALALARKPATQADWLALADEDEWLAMLETGGIAPHEWAELDDGRRARVVELGRDGEAAVGRDASVREPRDQERGLRRRAPARRSRPRPGLYQERGVGSRMDEDDDKRDRAEHKRRSVP